MQSRPLVDLEPDSVPERVAEPLRQPLAFQGTTRCQIRLRGRLPRLHALQSRVLGLQNGRVDLPLPRPGRAQDHGSGDVRAVASRCRPEIEQQISFGQPTLRGSGMRKSRPLSASHDRLERGSFRAVPDQPVVQLRGELPLGHPVLYEPQRLFQGSLRDLHGALDRRQLLRTLHGSKLFHRRRHVLPDHAAAALTELPTVPDADRPRLERDLAHLDALFESGGQRRGQAVLGQHDLGHAIYLGRCLFPVSEIGNQATLFGKDEQHAARAMEAGQVADVGRVGQKSGIQAARGQICPETGEPLASRSGRAGHSAPPPLWSRWASSLSKPTR